MTVTNGAVALSVGEFGTVGQSEGTIIEFDVLYVILFSSVYPRKLWTANSHIREIKVSDSLYLNVEIGIYIDVHGRIVCLIHNDIIEGHIFNEGGFSADVCRAGVIAAWLYIGQEKINSAGTIGENEV